jgi:hypothetical protein
MSVYHRYVLLLCILGEVSTGIKYSGPEQWFNIYPSRDNSNFNAIDGCILL